MSNFNQKIGVTRSLKPILQPVTLDPSMLTDLTSHYKEEDHFDAYTLFEYLLSRELASNGRGSPRIDIYDSFSRFHKDSLTVDLFNYQKQALGLTTIFDVIEFGKSRADAFFVD